MATVNPVFTSGTGSAFEVTFGNELTDVQKITVTAENVPDSLFAKGGYGHGDEAKNVFFRAKELDLVGAKTIGNYSFMGWDTATSLTVPEGVTSIGWNAFYQWTSATSLKLPDSLMSVGGSAFFQWTAATSLVIPNGLTALNDKSFSGWTSATSLTLGESLSSVYTSDDAEAGSLYGWTSLAEVVSLNATPVAPSDSAYGLFASSDTEPLATITSIKVPAAAVDAYKAAAGWSIYADKIVAIEE